MAASVTIEDVAREAGVSIKTVSRVVNREPNVREKTREKVQAVIDKLNYRPNQAARGLAGRRSYIVGLLYDALSANYLAHLQAGVLSSCYDAGYGLALCPAAMTDPAFVEQAINWMKNTQVDGVLVTPPLSDKKDLMDAIADHDIPAVVVSSLGTGLVPAVVIDEREAARQMAKHLLACGHTRIGFVMGPTDHYSSGERLAGFLAGLQEAGIESDSDLIFKGGFSFEAGVKAGEFFLAMENRPTAIFANNDDMATGVMHVAHSAGLAIPSDLAVAGFDDTPIARQVWPSLTTVRQPIRVMGMGAVDTLLAMIRSGGQTVNRDTPVQKVAFELKKRGSTLKSA